MNINPVQALGIALEARVRNIIINGASQLPEAIFPDSAIAACQNAVMGGQWIQPDGYVLSTQPTINQNADEAVLVVAMG